VLEKLRLLSTPANFDIHFVVAAGGRRGKAAGAGFSRYSSQSPAAKMDFFYSVIDYDGTRKE